MSTCLRYCCTGAFCTPEVLYPCCSWHHALMMPAMPCRRSVARSEAAKDAEAEYTAKQLQQHLPVGPQYLSREELIQQVKPTDAELALCALYSNRCGEVSVADVGNVHLKSTLSDRAS